MFMYANYVDTSLHLLCVLEFVVFLFWVAEILSTRLVVIGFSSAPCVHDLHGNQSSQFENRESLWPILKYV